MSKVKQSDIAKTLGVTEARVTQLKSKGMPTNSIDSAAAWYRSNIDQKLSPKLVPSIVPPAASDSMAAVSADAYDIQQSRAKREYHEANLAELKERQELRQLVNAHEVVKAVTSWAAMARSAFEKIPDKLSERFAAESDATEIHKLLAQEIDLVLADLSVGARNLKLSGEDGRP